MKKNDDYISYSERSKRRRREDRPIGGIIAVWVVSIIVFFVVYFLAS